MKKHKMEIAALSLLLGVLCYAFYDYNIKGSEQSFVLTNDLLTMREITSKEQITMEMLAIPSDDLLREQERRKEELEKQEEKKQEEVETIKEVTDEDVVLENKSYSINLAANVEENIPYNEILSNQIVNYALLFEGYPYVYGGNSLTGGTDCSGFTKLIYENYGIYLPRTAPAQASVGTRIGLDNIMPGDLVLSGYDSQIGHVAIYIGNEKLIHALNSNVGIVVTSLYIMPILDIRRVA